MALVFGALIELPFETPFELPFEYLTQYRFSSKVTPRYVTFVHDSMSLQFHVMCSSHVTSQLEASSTESSS